MKILTIDIETKPNLAHVWGLFNQNVSLTQLREGSRMICFAAKWYDNKRVIFYSDFHNGHEAMVNEAHRLLSEADVVVHYNGTTFDVPGLNREFLLAGLPPPSPFRQVDLLKTARKVFRFPSNKLDYVSQELGLPGKVNHEGHMLWVKCLMDDPKAWSMMRKYNKNDVVITEDLYEILRPWIKGHPNPALYDGSIVPTCQNCGGVDLVKRGFAYTQLAAYQQWRCNDCGAWSRSASRDHGIDVRGIS